MRLSNKFTLVRIVFAPIFLLLFFLPSYLNNTFNIDTNLFNVVTGWALIPLLGFAEFTDFLDGFYARKRGEVSDFGKLFDPFADVMLNLTLFICAQHSFAKDLVPAGYMPVACFILILFREFSMNFLRMVAVSNGTAIAARKGGKVKTVLYITSGFFMLAIESVLRLQINIADLLPILKAVAVVLFVICVFLSYLSFSDYIRTFSKVFKTKE